MARYRECDACGFKVDLPMGVDGWGYTGWGRHKECCLCPVCNPKYVNLEKEMDIKKNEALNRFLKL